MNERLSFSIPEKGNQVESVTQPTLARFGTLIEQGVPDAEQLRPGEQASRSLGPWELAVNRTDKGFTRYLRAQARLTTSPPFGYPPIDYAISITIADTGTIQVVGPFGDTDANYGDAKPTRRTRTTEKAEVETFTKNVFEQYGFSYSIADASAATDTAISALVAWVKGETDEASAVRDLVATSRQNQQKRTLSEGEFTQVNELLERLLAKEQPDNTNFINSLPVHVEGLKNVDEVTLETMKAGSSNIQEQVDLIGAMVADGRIANGADRGVSTVTRNRDELETVVIDLDPDHAQGITNESVRITLQSDQDRRGMVITYTNAYTSSSADEIISRSPQSAQFLLVTSDQNQPLIIEQRIDDAASASFTVPNVSLLKKITKVLNRVVMSGEFAQETDSSLIREVTPYAREIHRRNKTVPGNYVILNDSEYSLEQPYYDLTETLSFDVSEPPDISVSENDFYERGERVGPLSHVIQGYRGTVNEDYPQLLWWVGVTEDGVVKFAREPDRNLETEVNYGIIDIFGEDALPEESIDPVQIRTLSQSQLRELVQTLHDPRGLDVWLQTMDDAREEGDTTQNEITVGLFKEAVAKRTHQRTKEVSSWQEGHVAYELTSVAGVYDDDTVELTAEETGERDGATVRTTRTWVFQDGRFPTYACKSLKIGPVSINAQDELVDEDIFPQKVREGINLLQKFV